jgi:hypothetical protein
LGFLAKVNPRNPLSGVWERGDKPDGIASLTTWERETRFLRAKVNPRNKKSGFYFIWGFSQRLTQETRFLGSERGGE